MPDQRVAAAVRARLVQERLAARLAASLRRYFDRQAAHAIALYLLGASELIPDEETIRLVTLFERHVRAIVAAADRHAAEQLGAEADPDDVYRLQALILEVGQRIRMMTEQTRRAVRRTIAEGMARGYHPETIARGRPGEDFRGLRAVVAETYAGRAETIARTETALVWNGTTTERYGRAGVQYVRVHDGAGCGWRSHRDPDKADGSIRPLAEANARPVSHPNCRRAFSPVVARSLV